MKVSQLIAILQKIPQDVDVEVNDNQGGEVYAIAQVDSFDADETYQAVVMLHVNVDV